MSAYLSNRTGFHLRTDCIRKQLVQSLQLRFPGNELISACHQTAMHHNAQLVQCLLAHVTKILVRFKIQTDSISSIHRTRIVIVLNDLCTDNGIQNILLHLQTSGRPDVDDTID